MNAIESIRNEPHKWRQTEYTVRHDSGYEVWTYNWPVFLHCNPHPGGGWSLAYKFRFWRAWRWWSMNRPVALREG